MGILGGRSQPKTPHTRLKRCLIPLCTFLLLHCSHRQGEEEGGAYVILTFDPDSAAMAFYRNLAKSKADSQPPGLVVAAQAGKFIEDPFPV